MQNFHSLWLFCQIVKQTSTAAKNSFTFCLAMECDNWLPVLLDLWTCPSKLSDFNSSLSFIILDSLEPETESETQRLGNNLNQECEKLMSECDYLVLDVYRGGLCCSSLTFSLHLSETFDTCRTTPSGFHQVDLYA